MADVVLVEEVMMVVAEVVLRANVLLATRTCRPTPERSDATRRSHPRHWKLISPHRRISMHGTRRDTSHSSYDYLDQLIGLLLALLCNHRCIVPHSPPLHENGSGRFRAIR